EAHQRAPLHLRRPADRIAGDGVVELPPRVARSARRALHQGPRGRSRQHARAARVGARLSLALSPEESPTPLRRLMRVFALVRYRFFLYAGLLPYLLGAAWAHSVVGKFDPALFWSGLGGVVLSVIGVEAYNEYFDARMGTDRVFNPEDVPPIAQAVF